MSSLLGAGRATITNLICLSGLQHRDWTAHYRLYSRDRVDERVLFAHVSHSLQEELPESHPLVIAMDDTLIRKSGRYIFGAAWKRDPLGPPFHTNLVRGQRYLQFSAAWPLGGGDARMVPVAFHHAPSAPRPPAGATSQQCLEYRIASKQTNLNFLALDLMCRLRGETPGTRPVIFCGDGSYTNKAVLNGLPAGSVYLGRLRKDAVLHHLPEPGGIRPTGRRPSYGTLASTPEELRTSEAIPWQTVQAFAAGRQHGFRIKDLGPVLWRKAGAGTPVRILVIAPLGYRLRKGAKLLYRQPAYLLCSDPGLPLEQLLQYYLWRWGIEVNFREEKQLTGTGQAQVRGAAANQHQPAVSVASYALLWTAALQIHNSGGTMAQPARPRWRRAPQSHAKLPCTGELLRQLRYETWSGALNAETLCHFVNPGSLDTTTGKLTPSLPGALFAAA